MTTLSQRLRQKLLDLAIRGKLMPQNAHDESASELLARIRKARSTQKGGARTLTAPLPVTDDEQPFDLPKGWTWCRLGDIADVQLGKMLDAEKNKGRSFRYLANVSVRWGSFVLANLKTTLFADDEVERFALRPNDLLMCEGGVPGRCAIWREQNSDVKYQKALHRIRFTECLPDFYQIYFEAIHKSGFFVERFTGSTIHHLPREVLIGVPIPLPPLAEQKRIVAALNEMLAAADAVAAGTEKIATLKEKVRAKILDLAIRGKLVKQDADDEAADVLLARIRRGEMPAALTQRAQSSPRDAENLDRINRIHRIESDADPKTTLRSSAPFAFSASAPAGKKRNPVNPVNPVKTFPPIPDDEKPFDLPKGWAWCRLGEIAVKVVDGDHNPPKGCDQKTDYYMISSLNVNCNRLVDLDRVRYLSAEQHNECDKRTAVREGDILLTTVASLGRSCIFDGSAMVTCQRSVSVVNTLVDNRYVKVCFDSPYFQRMMQTESKGTAQKGFYLNQLISAPIPLPPLAEQKRIVAKVDEMLAACEKLGMRN